MLANRLVDGPRTKFGARVQVPFATFSEDLQGLEKLASSEAQAEELHAIYRRLYRLACDAARVGGEKMVVVDEEDDEGYLFQGEAKISYNLAMTKDAMVICPRTAEGSAVLDREGREVGKLSLNGTVLAGTALVKSEAEWNALKGDPGQLWEGLGKIGVPPGSPGLSGMAQT